MSCPLNASKLEELKQFIKICSTNTDILHHPDLKFLKDFIESLHGTIPPCKTSFDSPKSAKPAQEDAPPADGANDPESEPESDVEYDNAGCIDADVLSDEQKMGDSSKEEISEEDSDKADEKRMEAMSKLSDGDFDAAVKLLTEAIELNPTSALLFAKRGQCYLKLNKPNACIKDCTRALELNPDSAQAYKFRGRANRLLGHWLKAAKDLRTACSIDCDEQMDEWLREVEPNARKCEQHQLKQERKRAEKELKARQERVRQAQEANKRAKESFASFAAAADDEGDNDMPQMPAGGLGGFEQLFQDPSLMESMKDPEVAAALEDITKNPMNFMKYQSNPKVAAVMNKLAGKFMGGGGGGGMPGFPGMGGFPKGPGGGAPGAGAGQDDVGLD